VMKTMTFLAVVLYSMGPQIHAQDRLHAQDQCSNADLRGVYSFVASGTINGVGAFATAGQTAYEGDGNVAGLIQISLNGSITPMVSWSGTYSVDPVTCTATKAADIPGLGTVHFFVTAADDFKELRFIATDEGTAISGTARKQGNSR
jgi:hypothetical protein